MTDRRSSYDYDELLACGRGELFGAGNAQLPLPPMLMFDRISEIAEAAASTARAWCAPCSIVKPDLWFFPCHFKGDPVMPGCLGLDALWQLLGFFLGWLGAPGKGRALGLGEVKFSGQVLPTVKKVVYGIDIKRVMRRSWCSGLPRLAHGRWLGHLPGDGSQGRPVPRGRDAAERRVTAHSHRREPDYRRAQFTGIFRSAIGLSR